MFRDGLPLDVMRLVTPRAMKTYAQGLGWKPVPVGDGPVAVFHRPDSELHQVIIPLDESLDDFADSTAEVVRKLAEFERRSPEEVLNHLLLPPSDVFRFREIGTDTETGTLHLDEAVGLLDGTRRMLLSVAHSTLRPQPYHPRLSRVEAEQFVRNCRLGQTERGSFTVTLACPLDFVPGTLFEQEPFARRVTTGLLDCLHAIAQAADENRVDQLADQARFPYLSANLCEALLLLRPSGDRSRLSVSVAWSKALPQPERFAGAPAIDLLPESFDAAAYLAPKLREVPEQKHAAFVGFVDVLRGEAGVGGMMEGEVVFAIVLDGGELVRARAELPPDFYMEAGEAHLHNQPVYFRGYLIRGPRINQIEKVQDFRRLEVEQSAP
jgi:hypothetical protein